MSPELQDLSDREVIERAFRRAGSQASWLAIDELARRALIKPHYIPYGSHMAVARILNSGNETAIRRLLREMDGWTAYEQEDAISPWAGHKRVAESTRELVARYDWSPRYLQPT